MNKIKFDPKLTFKYLVSGLYLVLTVPVWAGWRWGEASVLCCALELCIMFPILLSWPDVCPVKTRELGPGVGVELLVAIPGPDFSFIDFCQTSVCPHIQCGRGGGEGGLWGRPGCVCHSTQCCCCSSQPQPQPAPTQGISFGKNTSIFSLNPTWILMSDLTAHQSH